MTPEAQRIAIAEACGWRMGTETVEHIDGYQWTETRKFWTSPTRKIYSLPDYLNDLNAVHEAESQSFDTAQREDFACRLLNIVTGEEFQRGDFVSITGVGFILTHATASQRAEAFLRTIGKWENS